MSVNVNINNTSYTIPNTGEENWGDNVTNWIVAASSFLLQRSGGSFPLSAEVDFGGSAGIKLLYASTRTTNPALSGVLRLANLDTIKWRNAANSADLALQVDAFNNLTYTGVVVPLSGLIDNDDIAPAAGIVYSKLNLSASIINADIATGAAIGRTKLAPGTPNHVVINDGIGDLSSEASLDETRGGTAQTTYATGDLLYASGVNTLAKRAAGANGLVLTMVGGVPDWAMIGTQDIQSKTANYTALATDGAVVCDASGGAFQITLYSPVTKGILTVSKTDSSFNAVTVTDGSLTTTLNTQGESVQLVSNGTAWIISQRTIPSKWTSNTPTGNWTTNTTYTGKWRRVGENIEQQVFIYLAGAPDPANLILNLLSGLTIDTSKLAYNTEPRAPLGELTVTDFTGATGIGVVSYSSSTSLELYYVINNDGANRYVQMDAINDTTPFIFAVDDTIKITYTVPISGWNG